MEERGEKYKVEHIGDLAEDARITFYQQGEYIDMCVGPHLIYTKALKAFKLTGVSGAYWKRRQEQQDAHSASTASPLPPRTSSTSTCTCSRRPRSATTARSAARWTSS